MGLAAVGSLTTWLSIIYAGPLAWCAGVLVWVDVPRRTKIQSMVLLLVGLVTIAVGYKKGVPADQAQALAGNAGLIGMLAAVSFLRLVTTPAASAKQRPIGQRSLGATLLGVHFFGAVVNLSTVFIMARQMATDGHLARDQYGVLVRGFAAAAFWSPFFAAMAAALTYAPGAKLSLLILYGAPLAVVALWLSYRDVIRHGPNAFVGYPMDLAGLWLPGVLAILVLGIHAWRPELSVLGVITALSPMVAALTLLVRGQGMVQALFGHIRHGLPAMRSELLLFLSAGVTAAGLASFIAATDIYLPFPHFGALQAGLLLLLLVGLSVVGVHPVIGIAVGAAIAAPLSPDPSLLASVFLAAWGIGIAVSPLSALNLGLQGAYDVRAKDILRWNAPFGALMIASATVVFFLHPGA